MGELRKMNFPSYMKYWGKAKKSPNEIGANYHLLAYHSLDVAAIGWRLLSDEKPLCIRLAKQLNVEPLWLRNWFSFCLSVHDLGKFARSFQSLAPELNNGLVKADLSMPYDIRHDSLGFSLWKKELKNDSFLGYELNKNNVCVRSIDLWLTAVMGHHGVPPIKSSRIHNHFKDEDIDAAKDYINHMLGFWPIDFSIFTQGDLISNLRLVSWQLAGVSVLADWLGSNQNYFHYHNEEYSLEHYWDKVALPKSKVALDEIPIPTTENISKFTSTRSLFGFSPSPLQAYAESVEISNKPQLHILEDVTGAGKTEAALILVHRLMAAGQAEGCYVALPTMATANAMYLRMGNTYRKFYNHDYKPSLILAHGARDLSELFNKSVILSEQIQDKNYSDEETASVVCRAWLADSKKKCLLADVGVGTIDQALLAVLPAKHQSLRLLGLSRKILLIDEVHAYDSYMQELLFKLLKMHALQGGSTILLSATLPFDMRMKLIKAYDPDDLVQHEVEPHKISFPLATLSMLGSMRETAVPAREAVSRKVLVKTLPDAERVIEVIRKSVDEGKCVCWIRNTVVSAIESYNVLRSRGIVLDDKLCLFHSRFAMIDRQRIEEDVLQKFGKCSSAENRAGRVLIATQVVEQSLDLDFDVMISDLAPIDLLIQRVGRLHRHPRDQRGDRVRHIDERGTPVLHLLSPDPTKNLSENWLAKCLPGTEFVYPHVGYLWLSAKILIDKKEFMMPNDARPLIEGVYGNADFDIPEALEKKSLEALGDEQSRKSMAKFNGLNLKKGYVRNSDDSGGWKDEVRIPTRLCDETVTVALANVENGDLVPYAKHAENPWAMSQLSIRLNQWESVKPLIPNQWRIKVDQLKAYESSLKWVEVLPLLERQSLYSENYGFSGAAS